MDIVTTKDLKKYFGKGACQVKALDGISLSIEKYKFTAIIGASGSGKTTLLNLIGGLCRPTQGTVTVDGTDLADLSEDQLTVFRRRKIGFVFQDCNLVPELTIRENILFPMALDDSLPDWSFFTSLITILGLDDKLDKYPYMLSGGAQQCAAIARALITRPSLILADEPTGSLDSKNSQTIARLLKTTTQTFRQTLILSTHDPALAQLADRIIHLKS